MSDTAERTVHGLRIRIDRTLCVGFGECVSAAPGAFRLDGQDVVVFADPEQVAREDLIAACDACPVDALTVWDEDGRQIVP